MKFTPEVIAALQTLKDHAENDFERHRIDVLERDLVAPPVVEQVDEKHQKFNGIIFRKKTDKHFGCELGLHRAVYSYYHGEIPAGYEVHHRNEDPTDNDVSNLQLKTHSEHQAWHMKNRPQKEYQCKYCGNLFLSSSVITPMFCSKSCSQKFRYKTDTEIRVCPICGAEFRIWKYSHQSCCSLECGNKSKETRTTIKKECPICHKEFYTKTESQVCCSSECRAKYTGLKNTKSPLIKKCAYCGKEFTVKRKNQQYCSHSCSVSANNKKRKHVARK